MHASLPTAVSSSVPDDPQPSPPWWTTGLWMAHALLRAVLFGYLMLYGWIKVVPFQMARPDYADGLRLVGEKSPMGLLWTFIGYSPTVQILSGVAEVTAGLLLIGRRTAWLGGLLGSAAMAVVFGMNMAYDVPVKDLSLALLVGCLVVVTPELGRLLRVVTGRSAGPIRVPRPIPWPRVHAVTRWIVAALALVVAFSPLAVLPGMLPAQSTSSLPGSYRVVDDAATPARRLVDDRRWQQVGFGQYLDHDGDGNVAVRYANGDLQLGTYRFVAPRSVELALEPVLAGDRRLADRTVERTVVLDVAPAGTDRIALVGGGLRLTVAPNPETRYLFDQPFSWTSSGSQR